MDREENVKKNSRIRIKVAFQLYGEWESANTIAQVCVHVNTINPEEENDFIDGRLGPANQVAGWKKYEYTASITTDSTGEIWIGVRNKCALGNPYDLLHRQFEYSNLSQLLINLRTFFLPFIS